MFPEVVPVEDPNRRYITPEFASWIREKAHIARWDLDVAADRESHWAPRWFSLQPYEGSSGVDGLAQSWLPPSQDSWDEDDDWRIICNPPFDDLASWFVKTWETVDLAAKLGIRLNISWVLPGDRHEQAFWQEHVEPYRDLAGGRFGYEVRSHFHEGRVNYAQPGSNGVAVGSAFFPSCLLVFRCRT